jgi:hypothetical protein
MSGDSASGPILMIDLVWRLGIRRPESVSNATLGVHPATHQPAPNKFVTFAKLRQP